MIKFLIILILLIASPLMAIASLSDEIIYPDAKTDNVEDDYYGTIIKDPYRWLEDADSEETLEWVEEENKITENFIASCPDKEKIKGPALQNYGITLNIQFREKRREVLFL